MTNGGVRRPGSEANTSLGCVSLIPGPGPGNKADVHISKFCNLRNTEAGALPFHNLCVSLHYACRVIYNSNT